MILRDRPASLTVTLLAGSERASRALVLNQLVEETHSRRLTVLTFDPQSQSLAAKQPIPLRQAEIRIAGSRLTIPSSAGLAQEINAILRQRSADEVIVELTGEVDLPDLCDTFLQGNSGGINLGNIARLARSIMVVKANSLWEEFWPSVASKESGTGNRFSESMHSRGHGLARSIECANELVVTDRSGVEAETFRRALRLLRALNPTAAIVDTRLKSFATNPLAASLEGTLWNDEADRAPHRLRSCWVVSDADCARLVMQAAWPFHPQRFHKFIKGAWRGVLRGRGFVWIASQPGTSYLWSQAGRVGVLSPKASVPLSTYGAPVKGWPQQMTFVGPQEVCAKACRHLEECLLTDAEFELGPRLWTAFIDPLGNGLSRDAVV